MLYRIDDYMIQCEVCEKLFPMSVDFEEIIDADEYTDIAKGVEDGLINRINCRLCGSEFTFENPILIYSWSAKMYVTANFPENAYSVKSLENILRISGAQDISLRKTQYAIEACEKIHISKSGLCDAKVELFKLLKFPDYKDMDIIEETIIFDRIENDQLVFSHRNFTDEILNVYRFSAFEYETLKHNLPEIPNGIWYQIDKYWVIKHTEDEI